MMCRVIDTLRKLIAHQKSAEDIGSDAEAALFAAKVQQLLFKHQLEMTDIELQHDGVDTENLFPERFGLPRRRSGWFERLALATARAHCCSIALWPGTGRSMFTLIGKPVDREIAAWMIVYLGRTARALCERDLKVILRAKPRTRRPAWRQSFLHAFTDAVAVRYMWQRRQIAETYGAAALVRIEGIDRSVASFIAAHFSAEKVPTLKRPTGFSTSGAQRGAMHGSLVRLTSNGVSGRTGGSHLLEGRKT